MLSGLDVLSLIVAHDPYHLHAPLGWIVQHIKIRRGGGFLVPQILFATSVSTN